MIQAPGGVLVLGLITGLTYGLLASGLILTYRASRIVNFAYGSVGTFSASVLGVWVVRTHLPYWAVFPVAIAIGAISSMVVELLAVRRLRNVPPVMSVVATLGVAGFLSAMANVVNTLIVSGSQYPEPPGVPQFSVGVFVVSPALLAQLIGTPVIVAALAAFMKFSRYGRAIRASASNRPAATLSGIAPGKMSLLAWSIAGAISAYAAILQFPSEGQISGSGAAVDIGLLARALLVAVVARMASYTVALAAGIALGIVEQLVLWNSSANPGRVELFVFAATFAALLLQRRQGARAQEEVAWTGLTAWPKLPSELRSAWPVRQAPLLLGAGLVVALVAIGLLPESADLIFTAVLGLSLVGLSVYVVTGLTGQLSLGQFALAGLGAVASYRLVEVRVEFTTSYLLAGLITAVVAAVLGLTALRIRGLMLAVTTLAFALMCSIWLFNQPWALGAGVNPGLPVIGGHPLSTARGYYLYCVPLFLVGFLLSWNLRRGGLGRRFIAVRDNEDAARAFSVPAVRVKVQAFAIAGFLAGLGGAIYGHSLPYLSAEAFSVQDSFTVVAMCALGGVSLLGGSLIGALYLIALPAFVTFSAAATAASTAGWLILILYFPGGLAQVLRPVRDAVVRLVVRHPAALSGSDVPGEATPAAEPGLGRLAVPDRSAAVSHDGQPLLIVCDVARRYGGIQAVSNVSLQVRPGEILGLIGPNGAGKTTLFEIIAGFTRADSGTVTFGGRDITRWSPERRCRAGMARSFQNARLFSTMTVEDVIVLATERQMPTHTVSSLLGLPPASRSEARKHAAARAVEAAMGLLGEADTPVAQLSTGTRRIAELACLVAMSPSLILLDEPSAGIAQRESEALAGVIRSLPVQLGVTVMIIEHDIPLITAVCDRVLAMSAGQPLALGSPAEVCADPDVIESYLGTNDLAIARSGTPGA
jgi:ABC-type branched-subunit amino acid transport system ATPase component/ABC-type branched-subunit amino acid transport system permease subunit